MASRAPIAITVGEPAGVGPELALAVARERADDVVLIGDLDLLRRHAGTPGLAANLSTAADARSALRVVHVPLGVAAVPGRPEVRNAGAVLAMLDAAVDGCLAGRYRALVTAPVDKGLLRRAGHPFTGHTEYLAARAGGAQPVMLLVGGTLRVALVTTHLPLREVAAAVTRARVEHVVRTLARALVRCFDVPAPRIAVCGLNPHAGEGGTLGEEDVQEIAPAIAALRAEGLAVSGPLAADTAFTPARLANCDAVVAMYHDQGLPTLKHASFGRAVNVTLGLPFVRTSVDHGTAYDLAGSGRADPSSLEAALELADDLSARA